MGSCRPTLAHHLPWRLR